MEKGVNDVKKRSLFHKRSKEVKELNIDGVITDWKGIITDIDALKDNGSITVEVFQGVYVYIPFDILKDEKIVDVVGELQKGDKVKFSSNLVKDDDLGFKEISWTTKGSLSEPTLKATITSISKIE